MRDFVINWLAIMGAAVVAYGLWLAYRPAGVAAVGATMILAAWVIARANEPVRRH